MTDDQFATRLRDDLAAAAGRLSPAPTVPPLGFIDRADRRRRRSRATAAALPIVATLMLLVGAVALLSGRDEGADSARVEAADERAAADGPPTVQDAFERADHETVEALSVLRRPTVTPVDGGFVVWGGTGVAGEDGGVSVGAQYSEAADAWRLVPPSPLPSGVDQAAVWTGRELVVAGGATDLAGSGPLSDVAAYDPEARRWRRLPDLPEPRAGAEAVHSTGRIVVAGGDEAGTSSTVLVGDSQRAWSRLAVDHPIYGAVAVDAGVVVYGFDDYEGERAPLELSLVVPTTPSVTPLPSLAPSDEVTAEYVGDFAVGARGDEIAVLLGADGTYGWHTLDISEGRWAGEAVVDADERILTPSRMAHQAGGELMLGRSATWLVTRHAVYGIDVASERVVPAVELDRRCADNHSVDDAARFGAGDRSILYWIDRSCDGEPSLGRREGALLVTLGGGP
jgi:hypothetical protein